MCLLRQYLNAVTMFASFISCRKLFQAFIVEEEKELKLRLVRARIDSISFVLLRLYGLLSPTSGATRSDR